MKLSITLRKVQDISPVYIMIAHKGKKDYIKTKYNVNKKGLKQTVNRLGKVSFEVKDTFILKECLNLIEEYQEKANRLDIDNMTVQDIKSELIKKEENESEEIFLFSEFAEQFITNMVLANRERPSRNYRSALNSLYDFLKKDKLEFKDLKGVDIKKWIKSLKHTNTAKRAYPSAIKTIFVEGTDIYNDYDEGIIKIANDPFKTVKFPKVTQARKRNISAEEIKAFFEIKVEATSLFQGKEVLSRKKLGQDVAKLIIYLAGINVADLYDFKKEALVNWKLQYERKKTRDKRDDRAYIEIEVPEEVRYLFKEYEGKDRLFNFSELYSTEENFCNYTDKGMNAIQKGITTYVFRHSWATIARNKLYVSKDDVSFCLNHSSGNKVTDLYIEEDFTLIDKINRRVIDYIFNKEKEAAD